MPKNEIRRVAKMMDEIGLTEISTESSVLFGLVREKIHLSKQQFCQVSSMGAGMLSPASEGGAHDLGGGRHAAPLNSITSPMIGVVYLSPDPDSKPFASVGAMVSKGDTLCLVEAMKTFNPVKSDRDGVVAEILVKDGDTVEFGTPLVVVR